MHLTWKLFLNRRIFFLLVLIQVLCTLVILSVLDECVPSPNSSTWEHFGEMVLRRNTFLSSNSWWLDISAASLTERLSRLLAKRRVIHLGAVIHKVLVIIMKAQIINKPRKGIDELDQEWKMEVALVKSHVPGHCPQHRREANEMKNVLRSSTRWWKGLENLT